MERGRLFLLSLVLAACGGEDDRFDADNSDGVDRGTAGASSGFDECDGACSADETCCRGVCVDLETDLDNCGACGAVCGGQNSNAECVAGECKVTCDDGFVDCDGDPANGCEGEDRGAPRATTGRRPMIGAFTGSLVTADQSNALRPTFTWRSSGEGSCGDLEYQIQVDDSCEVGKLDECTFESPELDERVAGTSFTPSEDLAVSNTVPMGTRYYWRVRACDGPERCSEWSSVHYADVGRDRQDVTGDGYPDVVVLHSAGYAIYPGGESFGADDEGAPTDIEAGRVFSEDGSTESYAEDNPVVIRFVGDVNGDGFNDFVGSGFRYFEVDAPNDVYVNSWWRYLFLGAADVADIEVVRFSVRDWGYALSHTTGAGDFNGDGFADLVAGKSLIPFEENETNPAGVPRAYVIYGAAEMSEEPPVAGEILAPLGDDGVYFASMTEFGDFNGDGYPDVAVAAPSEGAVHIVRGGAAPNFGIDVSFTYVNEPTPSGRCRDVRMASGDLDADGFDDLVLNCDEESRVLAYFGASTLPTSTDWEVTAEDFWSAVRDMALGDLDGDGALDVIGGQANVFFPYDRSEQLG